MAPVGPVGPSAVGDASSLHALRAVYEELARLEEALCVGRRPVSSTATKLAQTAARGGAATGAVARGAAGHVPAWLRPTAGENRWAVAATILVAIGLQVALPDRLTLLNRWLLPGLELALLIALVVATPVRFNRESRILRAASLTLSGLLTLANSWSAVLLVLGLVNGAEGQDAGPLLSTGAAIWLTNIIAFALWYWQFDRGGPVARAHAHQTLPDFRFVQMTAPRRRIPSGNRRSSTTCICRSPTRPRSARPTRCR